MSDTDWYLVDRAGRRYGPYDRPLVDQLVRDQELQPDTPVWHPGLAGWRRAESVLSFPASRREVPAATSPRAAPAQPVPKASVAKRAKAPVRAAARAARSAAPKPAATAVPLPTQELWQRALAGAFDLLIVIVALQAAARFFPQLPFWVGSPRFALVAWALFSGWLLGNTGRTPGTALFAVTVTRADGAKLDERSAWLRAAALPLTLLIMTLGAFFALVGTGLLILTLARLRAGHPAWWEQASGTRVAVGELAPGRRAFAIVISAIGFIVLLLLHADLR